MWFKVYEVPLVHFTGDSDQVTHRLYERLVRVHRCVPSRKFNKMCIPLLVLRSHGWKQPYMIPSISTCFHHEDTLHPLCSKWFVVMLAQASTNPLTNECNNHTGTKNQQRLILHINFVRLFEQKWSCCFLLCVFNFACGTTQQTC